MTRQHFHICLGNYFHPKIPAEHLFRQLSVMADLCGFLRASLEECGHLVSIGSTAARKDAINIYFEWFLNSPNYAEMLHTTGRRFGIICTELLTEDGRYNPYDNDADRSRMIYGNFARDAGFADFVWCLMSESTPVCRKLNPNSHFLPLGFVGGLQKLSPRASADCYIDFVATGVLDQRRANIATELSRRGYQAVALGLQPEHIRDSLLECSRLSLSVQKTETHQIFSFGRINHAIINKVPVLLEYDSGETYMSKYCRAVPAKEYLDACVDMVSRGDPSAMAAGNYELFKREMPMRPIMDQLVSDTEKQFKPLASVTDLSSLT